MYPKTQMLAALLAIPASVASGAECPAPDAVARTFFAEHRHFERENPSALRGVVTDAMRKRLQSEWECSEGHTRTCRLRYDLWSGLREGTMVEPVTFAKGSQSESKAVASYSFWAQSPGQQAQQRAGSVVLARGRRGCWKVDDFITPNSEALSQIIARPAPARAPKQR